MRVCEVCGATFDPNGTRAKYCSVACVKEKRREEERQYRERNLEKILERQRQKRNEKKQKDLRICKNCSVEFSRNGTKAEFCSRKCCEYFHNKKNNRQNYIKNAEERKNSAKEYRLKNWENVKKTKLECVKKEPIKYARMKIRSEIKSKGIEPHSEIVECLTKIRLVNRELKSLTTSAE